jgi:hypothetical protein
LIIQLVIEKLNDLIKKSLEERQATEIDLDIMVGSRKGNIRTRLEFDIGSGSGTFVVAFNPTDFKIKLRLECDFPLKEHSDVFAHSELSFVIPLSAVDTEDIVNRKLSSAITTIQAIL